MQEGIWVGKSLSRLGKFAPPLWPKKDDANETLYTLIRRLKSVVHEQTDLDIEAERGKGYQLKVKGLTPNPSPKGEGSRMKH